MPPRGEDHLSSSVPAGGRRCRANSISALSRLPVIRQLLRPGQVHSYGPHRSQRAALHLPAGAGPHPVVVLIHGGYWQARYGKILMRGLAADLALGGWAAWNIEYRRLGKGGGWPATFEDVAAAIDLLADLPAPLDLDSVSVVGHSAGGQLALWAAGRPKLPAGAPGSAPRVRLAAAVSQAGVNDLTATYRASEGGVVGRLVGASPEQAPDRWALADPMLQVPLDLPVLLVHGSADDTVPVRRSRDYVGAARAAGAHVEFVELDGVSGAHRAHIDPFGQAWKPAREWLGRWSFTDEREEETAA